MDTGRVRRVRTCHRNHRADRRGALALSRYCLDTSAYSHLVRGEQTLAEVVDAATWLGVPSIVIGELYLGFRGGSRRDRNERALAEFLEDPVVDEISVDHEVAVIYGEIAAALREAGTPLPSNDVWIAACSARVGAPLLTFDEHFQKIARIGTILLSPESG